MNTLNDIKNQVEQLATQINAPPELLPTYGGSKDNAHPHIEIRGATYQYVIVERGQELESRITFDVQELLYWIFQDITFNMANAYALAHRDSRRDYRRLLFSHQLDLFSKLNKHWQERYAQEISEILKSHPYVDTY